jgi:hypothetical protein
LSRTDRSASNPAGRPAWFRSGPSLDGVPPADLARPTFRRRVRRWLRDRLPDPAVRDRTMVLYCRQGVRSDTAWPGMFSEFFSVLGALHWGQAHGAAALRVDFRSPHYLDPSRGPNWWCYFFERDVMPFGERPSRADVHLNGRLSKYGRYGGFGDRIHGDTPHMYPMTTGVARAEVHRLFASHIHPRADIVAGVEARAASWFAPGAYVVGVHYRGTDTARHYPYYRMPYEAYADEVRSTLERAAPSRFHVFVATDEADFVTFMSRAFPGRVVCAPDAPRVASDDLPIHFNRSLAASGYQKGESALVDCLLLARSDYLIKGRSSLSDASLIVNDRLPFSFCIG